MMPESALEARFALLLRAFGADLPVPVREYQFAAPRRWRFDFAWIVDGRGVAVELDGGTYSGGRHTRPDGFRRDCEKLNAAVERGWTVLRYTGEMLDEDPESVIAQVRRVLAQR